MALSERSDCERLLGHRSVGQHRGADGVVGRLLGEVAVIPEAVVEDAGQFGSLGAEGGAATFEEDNGDDAPVRGIRKGSKPSIASAVVGASTGLAEDGDLIEVCMQGAGGAVVD